MDVRGDAERVRPGWKVSALLRRDVRDIDFGVRRFRLSQGPQREILETASRAFVTGFNTCLAVRQDDLAARLAHLGEQQLGHALEGAGMAAAMLDLLRFGRGRRLRALLAGPGAAHPYLVLAGAGRGYAALRRRPRRAARFLPAGAGTHPALHWLTWNGYGFHRAFGDSDGTIGGQRVPRRLTAEQRLLFDQGVGRALWFHECADPDGVALRIAEFLPSRHAALWSGVGLAATYTGGADVADLGRLAALAGEHRPSLAHGAALACAARTHAGPVPPHTAAAAHALTGALAGEAGDWVTTALAQTGEQAAGTGGYLLWHDAVRDLGRGYHGPAAGAVLPRGSRLLADPSGPARDGEDAAGLEPWDLTRYIPAQPAEADAPAQAAAGRRGGSSRARRENRPQ